MCLLHICRSVFGQSFHHFCSCMRMPVSASRTIGPFSSRRSELAYSSQSSSSGLAFAYQPTTCPIRICALASREATVGSVTSHCKFARRRSSSNGQAPLCPEESGRVRFQSQSSFNSVNACLGGAFVSEPGLRVEYQGRQVSHYDSYDHSFPRIKGSLVNLREYIASMRAEDVGCCGRCLTDTKQ